MSAEKIEWLKNENQKVNDEISMHKKKQEELRCRVKQLTENLNKRSNQLEAIKKRCEETKLQLTELMANEKKIIAIHEIEKSRYSKIRQAIEDHKAAIDGVTNRNIDKNVHCVNKPSAISPNLLSYNRCCREYQLDEKERNLTDRKSSLAKREQDLVIKRNHNSARIVRLRKLLQTSEAKRALRKEQLTAVKSKVNRRY
ncbi:uncharacterized protein LOC131432816 [Malaya genurostris]|uniref:uncharacterized protein LOC131432816 n=1 Tax=Malaya genurostris TaxID=325434 RepID=UPI0026F3CE85|nr:uncharacterized protein LOC131432816 [Malaya genurostris]